MNTLEKLCCDKRVSTKTLMDNDETYKKERDHSNYLYINLREKLTKEDVKMLDKLMISIQKKVEKENKFFFIKGCQSGLSFADEFFGF